MDGVLTDLRDVSLGPLCILADDVLLQIFGALDAASLARCAAVSHGMRVLAYTDELWKACLLEELPTTARLRWDRRGWRHSYLLCRNRLAEETSACDMMETYYAFCDVCRAMTVHTRVDVLIAPCSAVRGAGRQLLRQAQAGLES